MPLRELDCVDQRFVDVRRLVHHQHPAEPDDMPTEERQQVVPLAVSSQLGTGCRATRSPRPRARFAVPDRQDRDAVASAYPGTGDGQLRFDTGVRARAAPGRAARPRTGWPTVPSPPSATARILVRPRPRVESAIARTSLGVKSSARIALLTMGSDSSSGRLRMQSTRVRTGEVTGSLDVLRLEVRPVGDQDRAQGSVHDAFTRKGHFGQRRRALLRPAPALGGTSDGTRCHRRGSPYEWQVAWSAVRSARGHRERVRRRAGPDRLRPLIGDGRGSDGRRRRRARSPD